MESRRLSFLLLRQQLCVEGTSAFLLQTFGEMRSCEFLKKSEGSRTSYHPSSQEAQFSFGFCFFFFFSPTLFCLFHILFYEYSIKRERVIMNGCSTYIFLGPHMIKSKEMFTSTSKTSSPHF